MIHLTIWFYETSRILQPALLTQNYQRYYTITDDDADDGLLYRYTHYKTELYRAIVWFIDEVNHLRGMLQV